MATKEKEVQEEKISTPDVKQSGLFKIFILVFLFIVLLITLTKMNEKNIGKSSSPKSNETELPKKMAHHVSAVYNIISVKYDSIMLIEVKAHEEIQLQLTKDFFRMWSSAQIDVYDDHDVKRVLDGKTFVQGPKSNPTDNYFFSNDSDSSVAVKIGRCKSRKTCKINF
jgi:hypothetical protein